MRDDEWYGGMVGMRRMVKVYRMEGMKGLGEDSRWGGGGRCRGLEVGEGCGRLV
jgi:hypothetical protein